MIKRDVGKLPEVEIAEAGNLGLHRLRGSWQMVCNEQSDADQDYATANLCNIQAASDVATSSGENFAKGCHGTGLQLLWRYGQGQRPSVDQVRGH